LEITLKNFQDLMVWQKALALALASYPVLRSFLNEGLYGLTGQMSAEC
jgi:hypothetical protein